MEPKRKKMDQESTEKSKVDQEAAEERCWTDGTLCGKSCAAYREGGCGILLDLSKIAEGLRSLDDTLQRQSLPPLTPPVVQ
jgi:hypothetical protein